MASLPIDTLKQIGNIWRRLSAPGRIAVSATFVLAIGGLLVVTFWARTPSYVVLESDLSLTQSAKIADALDGHGIKFETRDRGTTILVAAQDASRARLKLASQNLVSGPGDSEVEQLSPFSDAAARSRALMRKREIELSQAISSFDGIDRATVIISAGHDSPYRKMQRPATASVNVRPDPGRNIGAGQVRGIVRTVANAVSGLTAENVTVTDADGRPLTSTRGGADDLGVGDSMNQRASYERELEEKLRVHLDRAAGPGHYSIGILADINFDSTQTTRETFDPDNRVLRMKDSKKKSTPIESGAGDENATGEAPRVAKEEEKIEEYEVPKTTTTEVKKTPVIVRISAGVTVDSNVFTGDTTALQEVLEKALGLDKTRGDELKVTAMPFAPIQFPDLEPQSTGFAMDSVLDLLQYVAAGLVGLGLLMFFRSVLRVRPGTAAPASTGTKLDLTVGDEELDLPEEQISPKVLERRKVKKEIARAIDQDPRGVAKLVAMWLDEEGA